MKILEAALALVEKRGLAVFTMRALARELGIDPMAVYHYFDDKNDLLAAAAEHALATLRPRATTRGGWRARLHALARAYLRFLRHSGELLRFVTADPRAAGRAGPYFDERFFAAIAPLRLPRAHALASRDAFVDLLHGISLGPTRSSARLELEVLFAGMRARQRIPTPCGP